MKLYRRETSDPRDRLATEVAAHAFFKRQGVGPVAELIAAGRIDLGPMLTHRIPLERAVEGLEMMEEKKDGAIKVILEPNGPSGE